MQTDEDTLIVEIMSRMFSKNLSGSYRKIKIFLLNF